MLGHKPVYTTRQNSVSPHLVLTSQMYQVSTYLATTKCITHSPMLIVHSSSFTMKQCGFVPIDFKHANKSTDSIYGQKLGKATRSYNRITPNSFSSKRLQGSLIEVVNLEKRDQRCSHRFGDMVKCMHVVALLPYKICSFSVMQEVHHQEINN